MKKFWDFVVTVFVISYIPVALLAIGWNSHRMCDLKVEADKAACLLFTSVFWPLVLPIKASIWITDPDTIAKFNLPTVKWGDK